LTGPSPLSTLRPVGSCNERAKRLRLSEADPLKDDAFVIRGGVMDLLPLRQALMTCLAYREYYGLSFFGENDLSVEETALSARLPNRQIRVSTVARIRACGHELFRSGDPPHLTLRFEISPTDAELGRLIGAFDLPIANPHPVE
jgi:hypothetical protein